MTTVQCSAVVGDGVAVVGAVGDAVRVARQVQSVQGEGDSCAQFVPVALRGRKSLEMNHQNFRKTVQGVSLGTFSPSLTAFTCRHLIPVQYLFLGEGVQAIQQRHLPCPGGDSEAQVPEWFEGD